MLGIQPAKHHQTLPASLPRVDVRNIGQDWFERHYPNEGSLTARLATSAPASEGKSLLWTQVRGGLLDRPEVRAHAAESVAPFDAELSDSLVQLQSSLRQPPFLILERAEQVGVESGNIVRLHLHGVDALMQGSTAARKHTLFLLEPPQQGHEDIARQGVGSVGAVDGSAHATHIGHA